MKTRIDPARLLPAYTVPEAAHYLHLPVATLRAWAVGRNYPTQAGQMRARPALKIPATKPPMLSFVNLVEAHVLAAITRDYNVPLQRVRSAVTYLQRSFDSEHPLIERALETDRHDLFIREAGKLVNISRGGQVAMENIVDMYLRRIEWDNAGLAKRLYPFTGKAEPQAPRAVVIDPQLAFGRPVLVGTSIPTQVIAERFKAGDSPIVLADDYGREPAEVLEAIRCELAVAA
jgi:uncharacterized protein (DUF433 family)